MTSDRLFSPFGNMNDEEWNALVGDGLSLGLNDFGSDFNFQYTDPTAQDHINPYPVTLSPPPADPYGSSNSQAAPPLYNPSLDQNTSIYPSAQPVDAVDLDSVFPFTHDHAQPVDAVDLGLTFPDTPTRYNTRSSVALKPPAGPAASIVPLDADDIRRRSSSASTSDDAAAELEMASRKFTREKPKYDPKHPWHRINTTTQGLTSRSGKINQYSAEAVYKQNIKNPFGTWSSLGYQFSYLDHGELAKLEYTADEIKEFIYHHPVSNPNKLRIWIQKTPADSCRRYPSATLSKCRFSKCPLRRENLNGTIQPGHMRVALDERSAKYEDRADPFYMAANFHLYCFEQFLDLPEICALKNVEVLADTRQLTNEPRMKWNASLSNVKEGVVAKRFIESCRKGRSPIKGFDGYPRPQPGVHIKPHELTLNHRMQQAKEGDRARSAKASLARRPQRETQLNVNLGDLERLVRAKVAQRKPQPPKTRVRKRDGEWYPAFSSDEDSDNGNGNDGNGGDGYGSGPDTPAGRPKRKKRRTGDGPGGGVVPVVADPAYAQPPTDWPATQLHSDYNYNASLLGSDGGQYAWPQYPAAETSFDQQQLPGGIASASTSAVGGCDGDDPAHQFTTTTATNDAGIADDGTEISAAGFGIDPSLDDTLFDYPPISGAAGVQVNLGVASSSSIPSPPATRRSSVTVPSDYPLNPEFSLSKPSKRSAPPAADDDDNNNAKRGRLSTPASASDKVSPKSKSSSSRKNTSSTSSPSPAAVQTPKTPKTPRRRSSRLSSKASGSGSDKGGSGGGSRSGSGGSAGSLGSLFEYDY